MQNRHNGIDDWQLKLIEQCETHEQLKQRETFWQHRLKTFDPYGVHEKKEYFYFIISFFRTFRLLGIQFFNHFNFYFVFVSCFILFFFFCLFFTSLQQLTKFSIQFCASYFFYSNFLMVSSIEFYFSRLFVIFLSLFLSFFLSFFYYFSLFIVATYCRLISVCQLINMINLLYYNFKSIISLKVYLV